VFQGQATQPPIAQPLAFGSFVACTRNTDHSNLAVERASGPQRRLSSRRLEFLHFRQDLF
jgi:hypothetical protein